jgi:hypothetical protein
MSGTASIASNPNNNNNVNNLIPSGNGLGDGASVSADTGSTTNLAYDAGTSLGTNGETNSNNVATAADASITRSGDDAGIVARTEQDLRNQPTSPTDDLVAANTGNTRKLTQDEIRIGRQAFGDKIDLSNVRIVNGDGGNPVAAAAFAKGNPAITLGDTIYFRSDRYSNDFSRNNDGQGVIAHELTHVWQWQTLGEGQFLAQYADETAYAVAAGTGPDGMYEVRSGVPFEHQTLEAQAMVVERFKQLHYKDGITPAEIREYQELNRILEGTGIYGK